MTSVPSRREYTDADRLLRTAIWQTGDSDAALLRSWIIDTKPADEPERISLTWPQLSELIAASDVDAPWPVESRWSFAQIATAAAAVVLVVSLLLIAFAR